MARSILLMMFAGWVVAGCGGQSVTVTLDPDDMLLRADLPPPSQKSTTGSLKTALTIAGRAPHRGADWSREVWTPDRGPRPMGVPPAPAPGIDSETIQLTIDPAARTIAGSAEIVFLSGTEIDSAQFDLSAAAIDQVVGGGYSFANGLLTITPAAPIPAGQKWTLTIGWHDAGVEQQVDFTPEGGGVILANLIGEPSTFFTFGYQFWPRLAGQAVFETLDFSVTHPGTHTLVMSGDPNGSKDNGDGTVTDSWVVAKQGTGNVALVLAGYQKAAGTCGSKTIEVYGIPGNSIDGYPIVPGTYVPVLQAACDELGARFGELAFGTVRLVGVDERFTNGYATPGLIVAPNYTFDDDGSGSFPERDFFLAHEFAHQWLGNQVLLTSLREAWLTEGGADWAAAAFLLAHWGRAEALRAWLTDSAVLLDYLAKGHADQPLLPDDTSSMEPRIYYNKGAWVLRMLEDVAGQQALQVAFQQYVASHDFVPGASADFEAAANSASGQDLAWFFDEWLKGTGVLSLQEQHSPKSGQVSLTVTQKTTWGGGQYFKMPLTIQAVNGSKSADTIVTIEGPSSIFQIPIP